MMKVFRRIVALALIAITAAQPVLFTQWDGRAFADGPAATGGQGSSSGGGINSQLNLDGSTLKVIEQHNVIVTHSLGGANGALVIATEPVDPTQPSSFAFYANASDGQSSVLFLGGSDSTGTWMNSTRITLADASTLQGMMYARGGNSASQGPAYFDGFWSNYWHYLTNPSDMDDDLEYAFYGAMGTAAVAGTAAGGVAAWGAMGGGQFAVGISANATTVIPHVTFGYGSGGVYTWAHGIGAAGFVMQGGAGPGTLVTITGIPILAPAAVATWVGTNPETGNCIIAAVQAFAHGWGF
jgi:hypothetical protein